VDIRVRRVYEAPAREDGTRILVDRLWPRGLARSRAAVDFWWRDLAPSDELRHWFAHDPARWDEFRRRYWAELGTHREALEAARNEIAGTKRVTLLFAARDEEHNNALALRDYLLRSRSP
jgi:uncharacterized protein YeaO (DUF488 family)